MYHAQDTVPIGLYLYLRADNFNSYFPASRLGYLSHIKYCKFFNLNYSILTYSATICDSGSIASCFANWLSGSVPSRARLKGSKERVEDVLLLALLAILPPPTFRVPLLSIICGEKRTNLSWQWHQWSMRYSKLAVTVICLSGCSNVSTHWKCSFGMGVSAATHTLNNCCFIQ